MGCQRSYLMITVLSKKKQKNWGSKIKRIENELEDVDIKYFKIHKSRPFLFPLPATNKQKNLKPVFATKTYFSCHWNLPICSWRNKTFLSKGLLQTSNYSIQSQDLVTFNLDEAFALFGWKKKVLSLSISLYIDDNHSFCYCVHPG